MWWEASENRFRHGAEDKFEQIWAEFSGSERGTYWDDSMDFTPTKPWTRFPSTFLTTPSRLVLSDVGHGVQIPQKFTSYLGRLTFQ
jgi:hypothetical protein